MGYRVSVRWHSLTYVTVGAFVVVALMVRFRHPALTETQLMLNYWWLWLGGLVICTAVMFLSARRL